MRELFIKGTLTLYIFHTSDIKIVSTGDARRFVNLLSYLIGHVTNYSFSGIFQVSDNYTYIVRKYYNVFRRFFFSKAIEQNEKYAL